MSYNNINYILIKLIIFSNLSFKYLLLSYAFVGIIEFSYALLVFGCSIAHAMEQGYIRLGETTGLDSHRVYRIWLGDLLR